MAESNSSEQLVPSHGEIILYQTSDGTTSIDVKLENDTVWLTQAQMALLFDKDKRTISEHISNIFREGELTRDVVVRKFRTTTPHGAIQSKTQTHDVLFYNLDVIISVGYRVKSKRGTQFRIWANSVLKDYLIKGYAVRNNLVQQKYDDLKALVEIMGRTMGYLDTPNNRILYAPDGRKRIADNALVALTLMIAESKTDEMDIMVKVVVNLINGENI